ncbi:MAG: hypothetical protein U5R46_06545 [Gammaproteobacteria bacterium]|nr:hypothetical protein [Gammaproteobacteria bacterium]
MHRASVSDGNHWHGRLERCAGFSADALAGSLEQLKSRPAVSMRVLHGPVLEELAAAAEQLSYQSAVYEAGKPEARVYQEFDYCGAVPDDHPIQYLGRWFETRLRSALALMTVPPVETGFTINDIVCQCYRPGELGITPHRDHVAYTGLIILVVLAGRGRYFVCPRRDGDGRREIESHPGWAILMPGPGYAGRSHRPFHMVTDIASVRYSVGLRHDHRKPG